MPVRVTAFIAAIAAVGISANVQIAGAHVGQAAATPASMIAPSSKQQDDGAFKLAQTNKSTNPKGFDANYDERTLAKKKKSNPKGFDANYDERTANKKKKKKKGSIETYMRSQ